MFNLIKSIKDHILESIDLTYKKQKIIETMEWHNAISCGMGGSGIGGKITEALMKRKIKQPVFVHNDYNIPLWVDDRTLVLSISYSGNTEETIDATKKAKEKNAKIIGITTGGILSKIVENYIKVPEGLPPRCAIAYLTVPQLIIVSKFNQSIIDDLKKTSSLLEENFNIISEQTQKLAEQLINTIPVIYSTASYLNPIAYRYQCQFNENSEIFAHSHFLPEMNHNEIMGINDMKEFTLIWLYDENYDQRYKKRMQITDSLIKEAFKKRFIITPNPSFKTEIEKTFFYIIFGDLLSYFVSVNKGIDPFPVKRIEELKKRMKQ